MIDMVNFKDNEFDLAIVDPPYGIGESNKSYFGNKRSKSSATETKNYQKKDWDFSIPDDKYFVELKRISKNEIIWGCNYYSHALVGGRIFWDKVIYGHLQSKGEIAYQSFNRLTTIFRYEWNGMLQEDMKNKEIRIHPTQKPIALYKWLLQNYANKGDKILDTHVGSGSSIIACLEEGFDITGYEIDKDYYDSACKRIKIYEAQLKIPF